MMKKIILVILMTCLSQLTFAENWKYITKDDSGSYYLDTDRIIKKEDEAHYWTKFVADQDNEELDLKKGDYTLSQNIDYCSDRTTYSAVVEDYLENGQLLSRDLDEGDEVFVVDEDQTDLAFFSAVCK